jgi:hypothetical protein
MEVNINEETDELETVEELEIEEWRVLLESIVASHITPLLERQQQLQTSFQSLLEMIPDKAIISSLLESNTQMMMQILGSQQTMAELLTLRLSPPEPIVPELIPEPEPIPVAIVEPESAVEDAPREAEPVEEKQPESSPRPRRQRL